MVALRKPKPEPEKMYEATQSYSGPDGTYAQGTRLQGDHPAVRAQFGHWMLADLPDDEKSRARAKSMWGQAIAEAPAGPPPPPRAQPASGRFRATGSWTIPDPDLQDVARIDAGDIVSADSEVYRRYPHLFVRHVEERWR